MSDSKSSWTVSELLEHDFIPSADDLSELNNQVINLMGVVNLIYRTAYEKVLSLPYATSYTDLPWRDGVYFAVEKGEIIYVGQSTSLRKRWQNRTDFRCSDYTRVYYMENKNCLLSIDQLEAFFIALFAPRHNQKLSSGRNNQYAWDWFCRVFDEPA